MSETVGIQGRVRSIEAAARGDPHRAVGGWHDGAVNRRIAAGHRRPGVTGRIRGETELAARLRLVVGRLNRRIRHRRAGVGAAAAAVGDGHRRGAWAAAAL
jgi:hypothetical protein